MDVKVNFKYTENWIPPRCRKPRPGKFDGEVTVSVKEIDDAPIAAIWRRWDWHYDKADWEDVIEIRVHDGEFYIPSGRYHDMPYICGIESVDGIHDHIQHLMNAWNSKQRNIDTANEAANSVAIINGELYWRIPEPLWSISHNYPYTFVNVELMGDVNVGAYYNIRNLYNISTDIDSLVGEDETCTPHDSFEILIPDAFTRDPQSARREWTEFKENERRKLVEMLVNELRSEDDPYYLTCETPDGSTVTARIEFEYDKSFTV